MGAVNSLYVRQSIKFKRGHFTFSKGAIRLVGGWKGASTKIRTTKKPGFPAGRDRKYALMSPMSAVKEKLSVHVCPLGNIGTSLLHAGRSCSAPMRAAQRGGG
jgi:hypothetical protein